MSDDEEDIITLDRGPISESLIFMRKVYVIMLVQFINILILLLCAICIENYRIFLFEFGILYLICISLTILLLIALNFIKKLSSRPYNIISIILVNIQLSYIVSVNGAVKNPTLSCASIVTIIVYYLGLILHSYYGSKIPNNGNQLIYTGSILLFVFCVFGRWPLSKLSLNIVEIMVSMFMVMLYNVLSILSFNIILIEYTSTGCIFNASLTIYTSIINLIYNMITGLQDFCKCKCCKCCCK